MFFGTFCLSRVMKTLRGGKKKKKNPKNGLFFWVVWPWSGCITCSWSCSFSLILSFSLLCVHFKRNEQNRSCIIKSRALVPISVTYPVSISIYTSSHSNLNWYKAECIILTKAGEIDAVMQDYTWIIDKCYQMFELPSHLTKTNKSTVIGNQRV